MYFVLYNKLNAYIQQKINREKKKQKRKGRRKNKRGKNSPEVIQRMAFVTFRFQVQNDTTRQTWQTLKLCVKMLYVCVIDQVRGQDGWILVKFFFACLLTERKSRSINSQKKNEATIQPS